MGRSALTLLAAALLAISSGAAGSAIAKEKEVKTMVHEEGDRVWLEGVKGWSPGDRQSSVHAAQESIMRAVGEDVSYHYLLGVSGLAFRMQVFKEGFCPSSPHPWCGYQCVSRSTEALPWDVRMFEVKSEQKAQAAEARKAVVESIDRGVPVQYGNEEDGLIVGYQKNGQEWICLHPYRGDKTFVETQWPWGVAVFTEPKKSVPGRRELAIGALEQAVEMSKTEEKGKYFVGFKAWDDYISRLKSLENMDEKARRDEMLGNAWIYECLARYRASAAIYLRDIAGEFPATAARHLKKAADLYDKMSKEVLGDKDHCTTSIAPYPSDSKDANTWTTEMRKAQIQRLERALPLEREAIAEIEKAVSVIDAETDRG